MREKLNEQAVQVTRWLARDTETHRRTIEDWLARTPRTLAIEVVRQVLQDQASHSLVKLVGSSLVMGLMLLFISAIGIGAINAVCSTQLPLWFAFFPLGPMVRDMNDKRKRAGRAEERAFWLLVRLGDREVIPRLVSQWQFVPAHEKKSERQKHVTQALTELATLATESDGVQESAEALRPLLNRFLDARPQAVRESDADMLLAVVRCLAKSGTKEDKRLLQRLSSIPQSRQENPALARKAASLTEDNLALLREAARLTLEPTSPLPLIVERAAITPSAPVQVVQQQNRL